MISISKNSSIPSDGSVTSIGEFAFLECADLTDITIPSSITSIGKGAFYECFALTSVTFERDSALTSIGDFAFAFCENLSGITIPERVTSIGNYAFCFNYSLENFVYCATLNEWNEITKGEDWNFHTDATVQFHNMVDGECTECGLKESTLVYGDANDDGKVDINDIILLNRYLAAYDYDTGTSHVNISRGSDANGSGEVDINDIILLNRYLAAYDYDIGSSTIVLGPAQ